MGRISKAVRAMAQNLDDIQDHPPGPQADFDAWCEQQDRQWETSFNRIDERSG